MLLFKKFACYQFYILSGCYFLGSGTSFATLMNAPHLPHTYPMIPHLLPSQSKVMNTSCVMLHILYLDLLRQSNS